VAAKAAASASGVFSIGSARRWDSMAASGPIVPGVRSVSGDIVDLLHPEYCATTT
jgi:hypothetical protein